MDTVHNLDNLKDKAVNNLLWAKNVTVQEKGKLSAEYVNLNVTDSVTQTGGEIDFLLMNLGGLMDADDSRDTYRGTISVQNSFTHSGGVARFHQGIGIYHNATFTAANLELVDAGANGKVSTSSENTVVTSYFSAGDTSKSTVTNLTMKGNGLSYPGGGYTQPLLNLYNQASLTVTGKFDYSKAGENTLWLDNGATLTANAGDILKDGYDSNKAGNISVTADFDKVVDRSWSLGTILLNTAETIEYQYKTLNAYNYANGWALGFLNGTPMDGEKVATVIEDADGSKANIYPNTPVQLGAGQSEISGNTYTPRLILGTENETAAKVTGTLTINGGSDSAAQAVTNKGGAAVDVDIQNGQLIAAGNTVNFKTIKNTASDTTWGSFYTTALSTTAEAITNLSDVSVGTAEGAGSSLSVTGDVAMVDYGSIEIDNGRLSVGGKITLGKESNIWVNDGSLNVAGDVAFGDNSDLDISSGTVDIGGKLVLKRDEGHTGWSGLWLRDATLVVRQGADLSGSEVWIGDESVGAGSGSGNLQILGGLTMNGGYIFADPSWVGGVENASKVTIDSLTNNTVTARMIAGQNSMFAIGVTDRDWLTNVVTHTPNLNMAENGNITAAMGLSGPLTLASTGELVVDGARTYTTGEGAANPGNVTFAANSLLVVDAGTLRGHGAGTAAITAASGNAAASAEVAEDASLYVFNAQTNQTVTVLQGFSLNNASNWDADNVFFDSRLLYTDAAGIVKNGPGGVGYAVTPKVRAATSVYPLISGGVANVIDTMFAQGLNDVFSANPGIAFLSRAVSDPYIGYSSELTAATVEGAARMAQAVGVNYLTNNLVNTMSKVGVGRFSLVNDTAPSARANPRGYGLWVTPYYNSIKADGLEAGHFNNKFDADFGGAALGLDHNVNESFRLGLAFNVGGGHSETRGKFNRTDSDFDFFGVSLYGSYKFDHNFGLSGDIGYLSTSHDIGQRLPGGLSDSAMGFGKLKADVDSEAWTVGLTGEYRIETDSLTVIPHLGLRYTSINTDDYNVKSAAGRIMRTSVDRQNLFSIPVGVTLTTDHHTEGGWSVTPMMDLGLIINTGDKDVDSSLRVPGINARGKVTGEMIDPVAFNGAIGIKANAGNGLDLGLDYTIQASDNYTSHNLSVLLRYEF